MMIVSTDDNRLKEYFVVETKRHKPCLIFRGYRYVQDKIQNRTIYWRCEDRAHCNGRAHQLVRNGSLPILTIKHNHLSMNDNIIVNESITSDSQSLQRRRQNLKTSYYQSRNEDDRLLSSTMTSPVKLENHQNRQQHLQQQQQQHGVMGKNLHLSEVITTATAATNPHHYNGGIGIHHSNVVDPIEMTKLLSNITTSTHSSSKAILTSSTMDYPSRLNHFSWEEIEGRYLPVIFRNENDCLQRYTSKMFVENTLFQSESWQRHALLARSRPPLISFPYTENELKLFRLIVEWHLASFHFKTILPSDCLIRFEDLLDFYGALRKLRDTVSTTSFSRPLPPTPPNIPPLIPMGPPKQRPPSSSNGLAQSFELPTSAGHPSIKSPMHQRHPSSARLYPSTAHHSHSSNYLLQQNADLLASFSNPASQSFNYTATPPKPNVPVLPPSSTLWNEGLLKSNDKTRPPLPRHIIPMNPSLPQEQSLRDKRLLTQKLPYQSLDNPSLSRDTKESGWVQINNVFVPYIVKIKLRENELEKCSTRQPPPQLLREFYVPYEILIKCHIFSDNEFAFKKFLIKATQQDFDVFNSLISNINIFDEKVPEKTLLVNLYHVMIGLQKILYVKLLTTKQPRTQVNKYHAEVLTHKGGTLLMHGNKLVPYIIQNNRFYVPLLYAYHSVPHILSQVKRGARAPRQYEIDYLNVLFLYFSIDSPPLTSDTLLVDAFSIKCADLQPPIHFRTLNEHQQYERNKLMNTIIRTTQSNTKLPNKSVPQQATKSSTLTNLSTHKSNKCPPANVVVNPLIHHPSFYGLPSSTSPIKQPSLSSSSSVSVNPLLLPTEFATKKSSQQPQIKIIKYDHHSLNAIVKSSDISSNEWKISIKDIFEQFTFDINYEKFIQWCQTNLLLPLIKLDNDERKLVNDMNDDYYVYHRHLDRCIALLNDLKRGTISMTLLPPVNNEPQQQQQAEPMKTQLAGAKKRKTTIPTTRHIPAQSSSPSLPVSTMNDSPSIPEDNGYPSPEVPLTEEPTSPSSTTAQNLIIDNDDDDDLMPSVATVEEKEEEEEHQQPVLELNPSDMNSSFLIVDSNECDDGKIQLDDTLPSCSSGYESAAALTNVDVNMAHQPSSDDDDDDDDATNSTTRSREHSSSCQSEQSLAPILSTVSSNIQLNSTQQEKTSISPVISNKKLTLRQRDKQGKFRARARSRSPTPRNIKKKRLSNEHLPSGNTITSDQIEQHLRTLLMPIHEQRRTRTRPIKTPTRLVEEIASDHSVKTTELDNNVSDMIPTTTYASNKTNINESITNPHHQPCTYNVTISNKPNKLGLTIKKVIQR